MGEHGNIERASALAQVPFFARLTERQRIQIAGLASERSVAAGEELCHEGEFDQHVFVIVEGEAEATVRGEHVGSVGAGEVVGEMAMLGDGHRRATLRATTPTRALIFEPDEIDDVLAAVPPAADELGPHDLR